MFYINFSVLNVSDIDECASHPCMHEGICVDLVDLYNCSCLPGYNGENCQTGNHFWIKKQS